MSGTQLYGIGITIVLFSCRATAPSGVGDEVMQQVFDRVSTPYKQGVVFRHPDSSAMTDSPSIYRWRRGWRMSYIVYDGRGYETWLAESPDLLLWTSLGRILSFTDTGWDAHQKAGYMALASTRRGGTHRPGRFDGWLWMSSLGGSVKGYKGVWARGWHGRRMRGVRRNVNGWTDRYSRRRMPMPIPSTTEPSTGAWSSTCPAIPRDAAS